MRRVGSVLIALVVVGAAIAVGYAIRFASEPEAESAEPVALETAQVLRTDLVQFETLTGTLQYAGEGEIRTALGGTVTSLPEEAEGLARGDVAFEIDGEPVIVLLGRRPAWRMLADGVADGADVAQLERNLIALGYGPEEWEADREFDADTANAVEAWREDLGLPEGAEIELGRVVFIPGPVRVGALGASVGQLVGVGTPVYQTTGLDQEVLIELDPDDVDLVSVGDPVTVVLPDDREVAGDIEEIGRVVRQSSPEPGASGYIEVFVALAERDLGLDQAPVDVEIESERAAGVLAVPVRALLALSDGGYAVEVDGQLIAVETGDFAVGLVEVTGALEAGDEVVIPR